MHKIVKSRMKRPVLVSRCGTVSGLQKIENEQTNPFRRNSMAALLVHGISKNRKKVEILSGAPFAAQGIRRGSRPTSL